MNSQPHVFLAYVASALVFGSLFVIGVLIYGGPVSRPFVVAAALFACFSQFIGQDAQRDLRIWRASIVAAYAGFTFALVALIMFARGL